MHDQSKSVDDESEETATSSAQTPESAAEERQAIAHRLKWLGMATSICAGVACANTF